MRPLQPEAVILVFDDNDFNDNLSKMNFDLEHYDQGERRNIWLRDFLLRFELPKFVFAKLQHNLLFLEALNQLGLYEMNDILRQRKSGAIETVEMPEYFDYTFEIIKKLHQACLADGSSFFVITIPHEKDYNEAGACEANQDLVKLVEFLKEEDIPYFDPCPELYAARRNYGRDECFNYNCSAAHMTELGHREFARILFKHIKLGDGL